MSLVLFQPAPFPGLVSPVLSSRRRHVKTLARAEAQYDEATEQFAYV